MNEEALAHWGLLRQKQAKNISRVRHEFNLFELMSVRETTVQSLTKDLHKCTQLLELGRSRKEGDMGGTPKTQETYEKFDHFNRRN